MGMDLLRSGRVLETTASSATTTISHWSTLRAYNSTHAPRFQSRRTETENRWIADDAGRMGKGL